MRSGVPELCHHDCGHVLVRLPEWFQWSQLCRYCGLLRFRVTLYMHNTTCMQGLSNYTAFHSTRHTLYMYINVVHGHTFGNRMIRRALSLCIEHRLGLADECFNDDPNGYCGGNPGYPKSWCTDEYPWVIRECQAFCGFCSKFLALSY